MRSRRPAGRLTFKDTARAGIVEWDPAKIADRSFMIVDEMEALQSKLESWCKTDPRKLIIFDNCENIFQDEQSAQENCWLHNLALTYDFDLNKVLHNNSGPFVNKSNYRLNSRSMSAMRW